MKTITKTIQVFRFSELSEEAKRQVVLSEQDYVQDGLVEEVALYREELNTIGIIDPAIMWSGFYSPGDGLSFTGRLSEEFIVEFLKDKAYKGIVKYVLQNWGFSISFERGTLPYVHEHTVHASFSFSHDTTAKQGEAFRVFEVDLTLWYVTKCRELYKKLSDYNDSLESFENMQELAEQDDAWFTEDGNRIMED